MSDQPITFELDGETWTLLRNQDKWRFGEVRVVERWMQLELPQLTQADQVAASIWVTVHRERPGFLPADMDGLPFELAAGIFDQIAAAALARAGRALASPLEADAGTEPTAPAE